MKVNIPEKVEGILEKIHANGYQAYIVGGCVRDMLLEESPSDFDITTSAEPADIKEMFARTVDTGIEHGTVTILIGNEGYEVTTYRIDGKYLDNRRPESVVFTKSLAEDLKRRDFTINAMAYSKEEGVIDFFNGRKDLRKGIIRCVGNPSERFEEDGLRMLRAIRFGARFRFEIHLDTQLAIKAKNYLIKQISGERIRIELTKILCSDNPEYIEQLVEYELIHYVLPEFEANINLIQNNPYHAYTVDKHTYIAIKSIKPDEHLRWTMYLHDIGKGTTKTTDEKGIDHFYGHVKISVKLAKGILARLKFDNKTKNRIIKLIDLHDYRFDTTEKSVRRAVAKIGADNFYDYLAVQEADIRGQAPSKLDKRLIDLEKKRMMFDDLIKQEYCTTIKDLAINGGDLKGLGIPEGKAVGIILKVLLKKVVDKPELNTKEELVILVDKLRKNIND